MNVRDEVEIIIEENEFIKKLSPSNVYLKYKTLIVKSWKIWAI